MSTKQSGVLAVTWFQPDTKNPSQTKEKLKAGLAKQAKAPGFQGVVFEGTFLEEPGTSVRVTKWATADAHQDDSATVFGDAAKHVKTSHYQMYDDYPLSPRPETIELVSHTLRDDVEFRDFYKAWGTSLKRVSAFKGCPYIALGQGIEDPTTGIQIQPWQTLDDHLVGYKTSAERPSISAELTTIVEKYLVGGWKGCTGGHIMLTDQGEAVLDA